MTINGVTIKNLKFYADHEGCECAQGNIYIDGKKMGFWSQDSWGGPDSYDSEELYAKVAERAKLFSEGYPQDNRYASIMGEPDVFLDTIISFMDEEKQYKKYRKQGYQVMMLVSNNVTTRGSVWRTLPSEETLTKTVERMASHLKGKWWKALYTDLSDFDIVCDKEHPVPERFIRN